MWKNAAFRLITSLLLLWPLQAYAANFTFSYGRATQCDDFELSWQGGVPPFHLTILPSYGTPRILDIPANAFANNKGTFRTTMLMATGQKMLAIMSDASGFASGGTSGVIAVGASISKAKCNTADPGVDFFYETNSALAQCRTYTFSGFDKAVQPIIIKGVVPGGSSFILNPPAGIVSFDWIADVAAGTQLVFFMQDANGRQGGSTEFQAVGMSDDKTCLDKNSPASVTNPPALTSTAVPTQTQTATKQPTSAAPSSSSTVAPSTTPPGESNTGTIAAAIVGTAVAILIVGTLIWFYLRRRNGGTAPFKGSWLGRRFQKKEVDLFKGDSNLPPSAALNPYPLYHPQDVSAPNSTVNLLTGRPSDAASGFGAASTINFAHPPNSAFTSQFPSSVHPDAGPDGSMYGGESGYHAANQHGTASQFGVSAYGAAAYGAAAVRPEGSVSSWDQSVTSSAARRKVAMAGVPTYQPPARFILHTDIEDDIPPPPDDEVIELPPQYSERRAPPHPPAQAAATTPGPSSPPPTMTTTNTATETAALPVTTFTEARSSPSPGLAYLTLDLDHDDSLSSHFGSNLRHS